MVWANWITAREAKSNSKGRFHCSLVMRAWGECSWADQIRVVFFVALGSRSLIGFHGSIDVLTACMKSWLWMAVTVLSSLSEATALFSIGNLGDHEGKEVPPGAGCPACRGVLLYYCTIPCRKRGHESHNRSQATVFIISSALSCSQEEAATEKSFNWSHPGPYMPWTIRAI